MSRGRCLRQRPRWSHCVQRPRCVFEFCFAFFCATSTCKPQVRARDTHLVSHLILEDIILCWRCLSPSPLLVSGGMSIPGFSAPLHAGWSPFPSESVYPNLYYGCSPDRKSFFFHCSFDRKWMQGRRIIVISMLSCGTVLFRSMFTYWHFCGVAGGIIRVIVLLVLSNSCHNPGLVSVAPCLMRFLTAATNSEHS